MFNNVHDVQKLFTNVRNVHCALLYIMHMDVEHRDPPTRRWGGSGGVDARGGGEGQVEAHIRRQPRRWMRGKRGVGPPKTSTVQHFGARGAQKRRTVCVPWIKFAHSTALWRPNVAKT